jgi:hypothetical protein
LYNSFSFSFSISLSGDFDTINKEKDKLTSYRSSMAEKLRNYTCADPNTPTSPPVDSYTFATVDNKNYTLNVLLDTDSAKIWTIDNIISESECAMFKEKSRPLLQRATVADADGTSVISSSRKANQ